MGKRTITPAQLDEFLEILNLQVADDNEGESDDEEQAPPPKKAKGKKEEPEDVDDQDDDSGDEDGDDSDSSDEAESDDDAGGPTREDVIDAIKAYVGKNKKGEREKAVAILKKHFGTGNVQKLDEEHFAKAIKLFSK